MPGYLRFRRTMRVAPGVRLNLSKSGLSTSFGPRGFHYTVGHGRRRTTYGVPGTGLSYTTYSSAHARSAQHAQQSAPAGRRADGHVVTPPPAGGGFAELAALTPPQKIAWGLVLTLLVITSPIGLWLLVTGVWQLHVPEWRIRTYVRQAAREPSNAAGLLDQAAAIDPHNPEVLAPLGELRIAQGDWRAALGLYREYCRMAPSDWLARGHLALAALKSNELDEAIAELTAIRREAPATEDSKASVTAHLAYAFLCKQDPQQARSLVETGKARLGSLGPGSQQCLFYRAVCEYMLGHTRVAVMHLDRLYAINPSFEGLQAVKDAMEAGTYELLLPQGAALVPVTPGHATRAAVAVVRTVPRSAHCQDCQAPLPAGAVECPYCHAAVTLKPQPSRVPRPPPATAS